MNLDEGQMPIANGISSKSFHGAKGGTEHFISVTAPGALGFEEQIAFVDQRYAQARKALGLAPETAVFRRLFLSDVINQAALVRTSGLFFEPTNDPVAVSIVQQPPLPGAKIALLAYHIEGEGIRRRRLSPKHVIVEKNGLRHLWSTRLCAGSYGSSASANAQTDQIFGDLINTISGEGGTLAEHCVRTWIYLKDVDVFYQGMVDSRRALFKQQGLTEETHYIASTGIEGACPHRFDLVLMDAYSILDLVPEQISYLDDFDRLCATKDYKVTFERGTRISYADRSHSFISGTASIDNAGRVVYPGDVLAQLDHTLSNIEALLQAGSASLTDMMHMIVYLRDPADCERVSKDLGDRFPDLPMVTVQGPVCRPEWLVEIEGIAMTHSDEPTLPLF